MMDRAAILAALIAFDRPLVRLREMLDTLDWAANPAATLRRADIAAVLRRFAAGSLGAAEVEHWANLVESREDLSFEPRHEEAIADALFDIGNPDLQGDLPAILDELLDALGD
jgi:hypothetical protein